MDSATPSTSPIRWGILGTGAIADKFATGLQSVPDATLAAVGSRAAATADAFADRFGAARRHASYEALAADPEIDIVYIATPHPMHHTAAKLCLNAGKAVLVEKPFTVNAVQAREVVALARERKLFLMEAMWTRFLPLMVRFRELIAAGAIGEPRLLTADFGFRHNGDAKPPPLQSRSRRGRPARRRGLRRLPGLDDLRAAGARHRHGRHRRRPAWTSRPRSPSATPAASWLN